MQFASLVSAWFALALPVIVIMYLFKRTYIDTEISSHFLWQRVLKEVEANRPWQKIRNHLLMLIQLLVAALLVLALMQPMIKMGSAQPAHLVIVIDRSASMDTYISGTMDAPQTRLEAAKEKALDDIKNHASGQLITLLAIGGQAELLLSKETDQQVIAQTISDLQIHYGRSAYQETMSLASALTRQESDAAIRVYTDGQWTESLHGMTFHVPVQVEKIADGELENVNIIQFGVKKDHSNENTVTGTATIKNWGQQTQTVEISLYQETDLITVQEITLAAGEQQTLFFSSLPVARFYQLVLDVDDLLKADNRSFAFLTDDPHKRALLLSPGNLFLEKALQLNDVIVVKTQPDDQGFMVIPETDVDLIIVDTLDPAMVDSNEWRALLREKPVWYIAYDLAPSEWIKPGVHYSIQEHPITEYIQLEDVHIAAAKQYEDFSGGEVIISAQHIPLVYCDIVDGQRRVLFTFDFHHSDLPLRSEFPILVGNTVHWLIAGQTGSLGHAMANDLIEISFSPKTVHTEWSDLLLSGTPQLVDDRPDSYFQTVPSVPGLYQFIERDASGEQIHSRYLHVVMDARESNLAFQPELVFTVEGQADTEHEFSTYSLLPWLIMLIILCIFVEWGVYQRGSSL